jgi:hypothetical protein
MGKEKQRMGLLRKIDFWLSLLIIFVTVVLAIGRVLNWYSLGFFVGPFRASHWLVIIGSTYIAVATPAFSILKKRLQARYEALVKFHVIGNLSAVLLVTLHFISQVTRSAANYPQLGNGLALYIVMLLLVVSGFLYRFRIIPHLNIGTNRFVHVGVALSFYILIGIHVLQGLGVL